MSGLVYLQGEFCDLSAARISLLDRGYLFGDSIFETLRSYAGVPFRLEQHLNRLEHSASVLGIKIPLSRKELASLILETLHRSAQLDSYIRVTISRGVGIGGVGLKDCNSPVLSIMIRPLSPYPEEAYMRGIHSIVVKTRRVPAVCLDPTIKCGNYLPSILARRELDACGMLEGVQLNVGGHVVCGTVSNVFLVCGRHLRTPDLKSGCLPGVTRAAVLELAVELGLTVVEEQIELGDLSQAEEMFFTNTLVECLPVAQLDSQRFVEAPGPVTRTIQSTWKQLVKRETTSQA